MSPSDSKLLRFPDKGLPGAKRPRDPRIDAFRGIALVMIFIDHVPGNPYERFTLRNWGFSDAAEAFFIMSGIAAGLAYSGRFSREARQRNGLWAAVKPMWLRAWTLYQVQILLTAWAVAIFAAGAIFYNLPELMTQINLRQVFNNTAAALIGIPTLGHQLGYVNILPAYAVLLLAGPAAMLLGMRWPWALAGAAVALWFAAGLWRLNLPAYPNPGGWFFNPFSWQLIFSIGLLTGMAARQGKRFVPYSPWLFGAALGYLLLVLAWIYVPGFGEFLNHQMARLGSLGAPFHIVSHDKTFVALPRLLHVLAMAYVLASLPIVTRLSGMTWAEPLRLMGRQGLLVFAGGTVLSLLFQVVMQAWGEPAWMGWVLPPMGIALSVALAWVAEWQKRPFQPRAPQEVGQGAEGWSAGHRHPAE
ncbi:OpgC domain-containing protein [Cereibacter sphaeroides]|nr:OpgC domain-containing protein [Cereibacter sphaeroides]